MEPLSVLSSVAAMVSIAAKVTQQVSLFISSVHQAKTGETDVRNELLRITHDLVLLQTLMFSRPDGPTDGLRLDAIGDEILQTLRQLEIKYSYQAPKSKLRRVIWSKKPLGDLDRRADIHKLRTIATKIESVLGVSQQLKQHPRNPVEDITVPYVNDEQSKILQWLSPLDYRNFQQEHRHLRVSGMTPRLYSFIDDYKAAHLIQDHAAEEYSAWKDSKPQPGCSSILWCQGVAGSGKSTLISFMIDKISEGLSPHCAMAYYFFDYRTQCPLSDVAAILLKQLALQSPKLVGAVRSLYERNQSESRPLTKDFLEILETLPLIFQQTYVILDAVDEHESYRKSDMVTFLVGIRSLGCHVVVSSRPEIYAPEINYRKGNGKTLKNSPIEVLLSYKPSTFFKLEVTSSEYEIRTYIKTRIEQAPALEYLDDKLKDTIVSTLGTKSAKKEFLLAAMQVNRFLAQVTSVTSEKDIDDIVSRLPTEFEGAVQQAFDEALESSEESQRDLAKSTFRWLLFARRPLSMRELCQVFALEARNKPGDGSLAKKLMPNPTTIRIACAGLVNIDESSSTVSFIHYLVHQHIASRRREIFPQGERQVALTCVAYMLEEFRMQHSVDEIGSIDVFRARPFLAYASEHWMYHCREKDIDDLITVHEGSPPVLTVSYRQAKSQYIDKITSKTLKLLQIKTSLEPSLVLGRSDREQANANFTRPPPHGLHPIHLAVRFGLLYEVKQLLRQEIPPNCTDDFGITPLHEAAAAGNEAVAMNLIDANATSVCSRRGRTFPVHYAAYYGHEDVLGLLIDDNIDAKDDMHMTPLHYAVKMGHHSTVELLLDLRHFDEACIDLATKDLCRRSLLHTAAYNGHAQIVGVLCDAKCPLDVLDLTKKAPLHLAVERGSELCVRKLIAYGADLDVKGYQDTTPLHQAVLKGRRDIVALLIDNGANINALEAQEKSALSYAIQLKDVSLVRLLVERGASVQRPGPGGERPLHEAARAGQKDVVQVLLNAGADSSQQDGKGKTASDIAWQEGHKRIFDILDGDV